VFTNFAVQLTGTFSQIGFDTSPGVNTLDFQSVGVTVLATVPEPASSALLALASVTMIGL
jgi:hypothetical protein